MTRTFRDDIRNRMIRGYLPFSSLKLLLCDALPSFIVVSLISVIAIAALQLTGHLMAWCLVLSLLINAVFVFCASLDGLKLPTARL